MGVELKSVSQLKGMSFYIPSYQRGYRWTDQHVKDLLNDINEFKPKDENDFYCLQPIVVKDKNTEEGVLAKINGKKGKFTNVEEIAQLLKGEWEVIDGQQRLTTIFLILKFLKTKPDRLKNFDWRGWKGYKLSYETRRGQENDSWKFLSGSMEGDEEAKIKKKKQSEVNIDFFHMWGAYETIDNWWNEKEKGSDFNGSCFAENILYKTRFIWYESCDEEPVKVFTRVNIGKISLTNAELIKALFLNRSNFNSDGEEHLKLRQQEIASEWDNMEYTLQNDEFWLFLHDTGYTNPTRIDFIFDLICHNDKLKVKGEIQKMHGGLKWEDIIGTDKYRTFRYFYEYFQLKEGDYIEKCWEMVKKYFQTFMEWYEDMILYHYIGYCLIECKQQNVETLMNKWDTCSNKESFVNFLRVEIIKKICSCPPSDFSYKEDGGDRGNCRPILLFHNIQTVINQNARQQENEKYQVGVFYRFPFNLYKIEGWDVEHINPNTDNSGKLEMDGSPRREWLVNVYLGATDEIRERIVEYFKETTTEADREKIFGEIKEGIQEETEEWSQEDKNKIWNFTLLDSSTNRSYGNSIFSGKRRVIIGKDKGVLIPVPKLTKNGDFDLGKETKNTSSFIPPCTKNVFLKYYSSAVGDNNYWGKTSDARSYMYDMEECIKQIYRTTVKTR